MDGVETEIQVRLLDGGIASLWDCLGRYSRGTIGLLLFLFAQERPVKVGELASTFGVSMPRVSSMLRRLEFQRLIHRVKRKDDHRSTYVELTPKGREKAKELVKTQKEIIQRLVTSVGEDTIRRFLADAKSIQLALNGILQEDSTCCD